MKNKIIQLVPTILALLIIGFRYFSQQRILTIPSCHSIWLHGMYFGITNPFFSFSIFSLPIAIALIFVSRTVFNSWLKLALWVLPLLFIFVATTPVNWTGIGLNLFPFYRDDAARVAGGFFTAVSLLFIAWRYFSLRRASRDAKVA